MHRITVTSLVFFWLLSSSSPLFPAPVSLAGQAGPVVGATTVLHHGTVLTMDSQSRVAEAVALQGDRIVAVGNNQEVLALAGPGTLRVDLRGKTVVPGLIDTHMHIVSGAQSLELVQLGGARSLADLQDVIRRAAAARPRGSWIITAGTWAPSQLKEKRFPTRRELDQAAPDHLVYVARGGHTAILNSLALARAGITRETRDPAGGRIERDPSGEPAGVILDKALPLARRVLPPVTLADQVRALREAQRAFHAVGLTGIRDAGVSARDVQVFKELWARGELTLRLRLLVRVEGTPALPGLLPLSGFGDRWLKFEGVKIGVDSAFEFALMSEPLREGHALQVMSLEELRAVIATANRQGWRVSTHALGDRAVELVVQLYEEANRTIPITGRRWTIEHGTVPRSERDIVAGTDSRQIFARIKALGLVLTVQHHPLIRVGSMLKSWGPVRAGYALPARDWLKAGIPIAGGSDFPVVPYSPFVVMKWLVTRETQDAGIIRGDQGLTREEGLRSYTSWAAYLSQEEEWRGSLEPGKAADLAVLSDNPLTVPGERLAEIVSLFTLVDGRIVHRAAGW
ncbi:MAG: amidohydrolase family protein [Deltaproteobacteria bacterium]|nr:amidohydrolase family protein [Deltaproteobacteria bacterium]